MDISEAFGTADTDELLKELEAQLPLLPEKDQEFILGCRMNTDSGFPLDAASKQRLKKINRQLTEVGHNTLNMGEALSPLAALRDLAGIRHRLSPQEQQFANGLALKLQQKVTLSGNEISRLFTMHKTKGF